MTNPLVSIVTPCYNAKDTISQTILSVINQTYQNWELLVVDDCSTDNTAEIIAEYSGKDNRIKYFKTDVSSGSPSLPRNIGIENAKGEYIAFLDSDDIWFPNKLKQQIDFIKNHGYRFVYSDYEKINHSGDRNNRIIRVPASSSFWDVIETCTIPCLTVILSREAIGKTRFKSVPKEDFVFWLDILKKDIIAYNEGEVLALYREGRKSRSSNKIEMIKNQWKVLRSVEGVKPIVASYFMLHYIFRGILKFVK